MNGHNFRLYSFPKIRRTIILIIFLLACYQFLWIFTASTPTLDGPTTTETIVKDLGKLVQQDDESINREQSPIIPTTQDLTQKIQTQTTQTTQTQMEQSSQELDCRDDWGKSEGVDLVITYVNGSDPKFLKALEHWTKVNKANRDQTLRMRFEDHDELRYALRSANMMMPWIRLIHILTNLDQVPNWIDPSHPKIRIVPHSSIYPNQDHLPTFNIWSLGMHLHRIPHLSRRFLFFHDDMFIRHPINITYWFNSDGGQPVYVEGSTVPSKKSNVNNEWKALNFAAKLLSSIHGNQTRHYPAHVPLVIETDLWREIVEEFPEEVDQCSANRFRSVNDIHNKFMYYYWLMERESPTFNLNFILKSMDFDQDQALTGCELVTLADFAGISREELETDFIDLKIGDSDFQLENVKVSRRVRNLVEMEFEKREQERQAYFLPKNQDYKFVLLKRGTYIKALEKALSINKTMLCLNDDLLDYTTHPNVHQALQDFWEILFPEPSPWELIPPKQILTQPVVETSWQVGDSRSLTHWWGNWQPPRSSAQKSGITAGTATETETETETDEMETQATRKMESAPRVVVREKF
eukprot:TRINITY_DN1398_c0_g2_i3.p1 TRINITY_DN1398_c0_g2~~TRINITY_DN1398_c0_g2_i3.p1  ORF type:complete len:581 (-),score=138.69 TRINITY_DN1398_c0_g2_i3:9-1751(-)